MQTEDVIFSNRSDARRVYRRLRDYSVLSSLCGREVRILVPANKTPDSVREFAIRLHNEVR